jgi:hypothetical protein
MNTDTPRTDAYQMIDGMAHDHLWRSFAETLERELTAARAEIDKWEQIACDKLSEVCRQIEKTRLVTEQRDRLAEALKLCVERIEHHTEFGALVQLDIIAMHSARETLQSLTTNEL